MCDIPLKYVLFGEWQVTTDIFNNLQLDEGLPYNPNKDKMLSAP